MLTHLAFLLPFISFIYSGVWDVSIQVFFSSAIIVLFFFFLIKNFFLGKICLPLNSSILTINFFLLAISYSASPVRNLISFEFANFLISLLFLFINLNVKNETFPLILKISYLFIFVSTFILLYNMFSAKSLLPASAITNPNTLAFTCILFLGLTLENKNYILSFYLLIALFLTQSVGGVVSFFLVLFYYLFKKKVDKKILFLFSILFFIFILLSFNFSSLSDRLQWWKDAFFIFGDRPFYGWGYGSYPFVYPAYHRPFSSLSSIYVHNYYLEFLCENGIINFLLWFYFLFRLIFNSYGFYRYSLIACLIHSFIDFGLISINNFWLFLLILGISQRQKVEIKFRDAKIFFVAVIILLALALKWISLATENVKIEKAINDSVKFLSENHKDRAYEVLSFAAKKFPDNFDLNLRLADVILEKAIETADKKLLFKAVEQLEYILLLNPYCTGAYRKLEVIYNQVGEKGILKELKIREKKYIKWKK